ncbi:MAG: hypothetical protein ACRDAG_01265 [Cetobacterium somerae]
MITKYTLLLFATVLLALACIEVVRLELRDERVYIIDREER